MFARKYAFVTFTVAVLVMIGFAVKNPGNMELSAAISGSASPEQTQVSASPEPSIAPAESPRASTPKPKPTVKPSGAAAHSSAVNGQTVSSGSPTPTTSPAQEDSAQPSAQPTVQPTVQPNVQPAVRPSQEPDPTPKPASSGSTPKPEVTPQPASEPSAGSKGVDDPVPDEKKVTLSDSEIENVVKQYDAILEADQADQALPDWKKKADLLIAKGLDYLGTPYVFGAKAGDTDSFDCSSFLKYIFAGQEVTLPRDSRQQSQRGSEVAINQLREGDLVFFTTPKRKNNKGIERIGHVAVYIGDGLILHTFRPGIGVTVSELKGPWKDRFIEAKRVL
ncbi:C40 family peptidase [Paenibacillus aestuarii]|uniref:NlpC/P60 family protein n=1 Tax=Paenibacillus aestuarii TaxID=516965 RepID=A0ABW0K0L3_9BACL|nr:C40 family peptidase [Paenibacillus aestuarii]